MEDDDPPSARGSSMETLALAAAAFAIATTILHVATALMATARCRVRRASETPDGANLPPVSIIRPLCGIDAYEADTLRSAFRLDHPSYEVILCVASPDDPVIPLARATMAAHPHIPARLLIGDDPISPNPKLNNIVKGWRVVQHDWVAIVDSNVLMPRDYLARLLHTWRADTGIVCAPPIGALPQGFGAEVECAFLNTYQARWQYAVDTLGLGFAQGKTMLWRRADLEAGGGMAALGSEVAEDAAATKVVRALGLRVRLVDAPFPQPLGRRTLMQVWNRQVRWARLRRASFPAFYAPEVLTGLAPPLLAAMWAAPEFDLSPLAVAAAMILLWFGAEARLATAAGWHLSWRSPFAWALRDLSLPILWAAALTGSALTWRGNQMRATPGSKTNPGSKSDPAAAVGG
jgi:ceramide glucosyltransferase